MVRRPRRIIKVRPSRLPRRRVFKRPNIAISKNSIGDGGIVPERRLAGDPRGFQILRLFAQQREQLHNDLDLRQEDYVNSGKQQDDQTTLTC